MITDASGNVVQHVEYVPFGETFIDERQSQSSWSTPYLFNGKERDEETGLLYFGARYQDSKYGIWYSVDPLAETTPNISSFVYCNDNPVNMVDPDGRSTHTNQNGYVVAVYNDKDNGVYRHTDEQLKNFDPNKMSLGKIGAEKMGETKHWNEFVDRAGQTMTNYQIKFDGNWNPIIEEYEKKAKDMGLIGVAKESKNYGVFDLKSKDKYHNKAMKLNGYYATDESAGNYLVGH